MECPACGKAVKTEHGLVKHLAGGFSYGGHELPKTKAESVAASVGAGTPFEPSLGKPDAVEKAVPATYLEEVFTRIVEFKRLPKYQFERRVDALLLPFLPDLLGQVMSGQVQHVIPEFPLKKPGTFQSTNVDHLFYLRGASPPLDRWLLFELKTDMGSVDLAQIETYIHYAGLGMERLLDDIEGIAGASKSSARYAKLLAHLRGYDDRTSITVVYLSPAAVKSAPTARDFKQFTFEQLSRLSVSRYSEEWNHFRATVMPSLVPFPFPGQAGSESD